MITTAALRTARLAFVKLPVLVQIAARIALSVGVGLLVLSTLGTHRGP